MREEFKPAIDALLMDLGEQEKQVVDTKMVINRLCARAGVEAMFPDAAAAASNQSIGSIRPDTFYGKVLNTAAREYLEMRRAANLGPATPREVFEAIVKGGYASEAQDDETALVAARATLRKNSSTFHRLPNGTYGLLTWYPNAKPQKDDEEDARSTSSRGAKKKKKARSAKRASAPRETKAEDGVPKATKIRDRLKTLLANGPMSKIDILRIMIGDGILGSEDDPGANLSTYLSRSKDLVKSDGEGKWSLVASSPGAAAWN